MGLEAVVRRLAVPPPVSLVHAGRAVVHDDAPIEVAVGDEDFPRRRIEAETRGSAETRGVAAPSRLVPFSQLHQKLPGWRELQHEVVSAANPDIALRIHVEVVLPESL